MTNSVRPDVSALTVPMDAWSQPFWDAAAEHRLVMPHCQDCGRFRWPAGPFCPNCRSQRLAWVPPGTARIYSFTLLPVASGGDEPPRLRCPALVEFDDAEGVRLVTSIVDSPIADIQIGAAVEVDWIAAANATAPVFRTR